MSEEKDEKKEEKKEAVRPILIVPWVDKAGHAVIKTTNKEDAEILNTALDNSHGVLVKEPEEEENVCPAEPNVPFKESVCSKMLKAFEKARKKARKSEAD